MSATDAELETLCRACGLCCDGSLFGRVSLAPEERAAARRHRLRLAPSGAAFEQPCAALTPTSDGGRACAIYAERPGACRRFVCKLHERHRREGGPLAPRLAVVHRVRELLATLDADGTQQDAFRELVTRMDEDFARA